MSIKRFICCALLAIVIGGVAPSPASAKDRDLDRIAACLQESYGAKRMGGFVGWMAGMGAKFARPSGMKGVSIRLFEREREATATDGNLLDATTRTALGPDWSPIVRVRRRGDDETFIYARWRKEELEVTVVTLSRSDAIIVRARVAPEHLRDLINDGDDSDDDRAQTPSTRAIDASRFAPGF